MPGRAVDEQPTWEQVLARFEATAAQTEALLAGGDPAAAAELINVEYDPFQLGLPALPAALHDRARAVAARTAALIDELQTAMVVVRHQTQLAEDTASAPRAVYVDCRA